MSEPSAHIDAQFAVANGRTQMVACAAKSPLKIAKTFRDGRALEVCVMDASPGLLAGDFYKLRWQLAAGTDVRIGTQGFTRVHPSQGNPCLLRQEIELETGARLKYFPEPLMLYTDASLRSECAVNLEAGAELLIAETVCAGRVGHGEEFLFHDLKNQVCVSLDGALIYVNHTHTQPGARPAKRIAAWQGFTHQTTFCYFGPRADEELRDSVREQLVGVSTTGAVWGGVSLLDKYGLVVNLMGNRAHDLQTVVRELRDSFSPCE